MIKAVTVRDTWQEKMLHRRGYCAALLEANPKPIRWKSHTTASILMNHYSLKPLELWQWMYGARIEPWEVRGRWYMSVQSRPLVCLALKCSLPFLVWSREMMEDYLKTLDTFPKHTWQRNEDKTLAVLTASPKEHYEGVPEEDMIYQRLGYCAGVLERTRAWYKWENGHITLQLRHHNLDVLNMVSRIAWRPGGPDPSGNRWVLTMNNQDKVHRFLTIMKDFVIIPETYEAIKLMLEGQEPKKVLDISPEM